MPMKKRKGSGRPSMVFPHSDFSVMPIPVSENAVRKMRKEEKEEKAAASSSREAVEKLISLAKEKESRQAPDVSLDSFLKSSEIKDAARSMHTRTAHRKSYPANLIRLDAIDRVIKNTGIMLGNGQIQIGTRQTYMLKSGSCTVMVDYSPFFEELAITCLEDSERCAELVNALAEYFSKAGVIKDYPGNRCKVLDKADIGKDPLKECAEGYPAMWIEGASAEDIQKATKLAKWCCGTVNIYATPSFWSTGKRALHIKNVLGQEGCLTLPLGTASGSNVAIMMKLIAEAGKAYDGILFEDKCGVSMLIDGTEDYDGEDITQLPLFKAPEPPEEEPEVQEDQEEDVHEDQAGEDLEKELKAAKEDVASLCRQLEEERRAYKELKKEKGSSAEESRKAAEHAEAEKEELSARISALEEERKELTDKLTEYANLLRDQKETDEYEQILKASDEEKKSLKRKIADLEAANETLKCSFEAMKKRNSDGEAIISRGFELDLFDGEVREFVLSAVEKEYAQSIEGSRRRHVLGDILCSNKYEHLLEEKKDRLKAICCTHSGDLGCSAALSDLEREGFIVKTDAGHPKFEYYGDSRYVSVVSKTSSDHRAALNQVSDMAKMCF